MSAIIYKLVLPDGHFYYGSTKRELKTRLMWHKSDCKKRTYKLYNYINLENIEWNKINAIEVENVPIDLRKDKEREYIETHISDPLCLNFEIPNRTQKEWSQVPKNKAKKRDLDKKYYEKNKETIYEKQKEYNKHHREQINDYLRNYRKRPENVLKEQERQRQVDCPCGGTYTKNHAMRHFKTEKHLHYLS